MIRQYIPYDIPTNELMWLIAGIVLGAILMAIIDFIIDRIGE